MFSSTSPPQVHSLLVLGSFTLCVQEIFNKYNNSFHEFGINGHPYWRHRRSGDGALNAAFTDQEEEAFSQQVISSTEPTGFTSSLFIQPGKINWFRCCRISQPPHSAAFNQICCNCFKVLQSNWSFQFKRQTKTEVLEKPQVSSEAFRLTRRWKEGGNDGDLRQRGRAFEVQTNRTKIRNTNWRDVKY